MTPLFLCIYRTKIFFCILNTSFSKYLLAQNILSHPWQPCFYISTLPRYSFASLTPLFYVSTQPKYSCASMTSTFSCINLTNIFFCIPDTPISTYPLDQSILAHPQHLHLYVSTRPKYSCASSTSPSLRVYSAKTFFLSLDTLNSTYLLHQNIRAHASHLNKIFVHIPVRFISTYLLGQNILAHPWHLNFYVPTWSKYSCAPLILPFLCTCTCSNKYSCAPSIPLFLGIYRPNHSWPLTLLNSSISTYLLDHNILAHPRFLHFYVSTGP